MRRDDAIRIRHMIEAAEACERFVSGRGRTELETNLMLRFAPVRAAEIFGEAASKVSLETREIAPSIPWREIVAMRNRLIMPISTSITTPCGRRRLKKFRRP
jgi:uncharacterized protein with HEPN domain